MSLTSIDVLDTAIKIGLGAFISAVSGYLVLIKTQKHEESKEEKKQFYKLQDEKKLKYVEFLSQSQGLIQSYLYIDCNADSDDYKKYLRAFNEVQIISNDEIRIVAHNLVVAVGSFILYNKCESNTDLIDAMVKSAREKVSIFQKYAQDEVVKYYSKRV